MGIRASGSPIVVFMDDDVFPTNHFVEAHLSAHEDTDGVVFCGRDPVSTRMGQKK